MSQNPEELGGNENETDADAAVPTPYDRQQDQTAEEKDQQIAELTARLEAVQSQVAPPDAVVSNQTPGLSGPGDVGSSDAEAQFHEVPPAGSDAGSPETAGAVSADALAAAVVDELSTDEEVSVNSGPELSDTSQVTNESVRNQEELKEAVGEILVLVREIHETVAWVKAEAPKVGAALAASPFGQMLPSFVKGF